MLERVLAFAIVAGAIFALASLANRDDAPPAFEPAPGFEEPTPAPPPAPARVVPLQAEPAHDDEEEEEEDEPAPAPTEPRRKKGKRGG